MLDWTNDAHHIHVRSHSAIIHIDLVMSPRKTHPKPNT